ncbi:hypothetical protein BN134_3853 [Cronobacter dublinensis 1210]|uniref:Uncharacterized protein n=1 Tax=Cronobacter dublinensis 1210 TaxID=1208656 RepID=A0ABM9QBQ9_9ENTR|nr:hypothetical protein BN134_3853 [Cronobacter dublinensis 1210]
MRFLLMIFSFAALLSAPAFSAALPNAGMTRAQTRMSHTTFITMRRRRG